MFCSWIIENKAEKKLPCIQIATPSFALSLSLCVLSVSVGFDLDVCFYYIQYFQLICIHFFDPVGDFRENHKAMLSLN